MPDDKLSAQTRLYLKELLQDGFDRWSGEWDPVLQDMDDRLSELEAEKIERETRAKIEREHAKGDATHRKDRRTFWIAVLAAAGGLLSGPVTSWIKHLFNW